MSDMWQILLEGIFYIFFLIFYLNLNYLLIVCKGSYIPSPDAYQCHFYVEKFNRKGKTQIRCLVISTSHIYNISVKSGRELGKTKVCYFIIILYFIMF